MCKTDSQWEPSIQHRELSSVLWGNLDGWGGGFKREGIYGHIRQIHFVVQQKLTQYSKVTIPRLIHPSIQPAIYLSIYLSVYLSMYLSLWFPLWLRGQSVCPQCGRHGFDPWVRKIPWRRKWQPTPVFLPGEYRGLRSLVGYSPQGRKELDTTVRLHFYIYLKTCQFENKVRQTYFLHHTIHSKPLPCEEKYTILVYW